jgi:hypothetical protein
MVRLVRLKMVEIAFAPEHPKVTLTAPVPQRLKVTGRVILTPLTTYLARSGVAVVASQ